jgi:hypothetical protein
VGTVKAVFLEIIPSQSLLAPLSSNFLSYKIKNIFPSGEQILLYKDRLVDTVQRRRQIVVA